MNRTEKQVLTCIFANFYENNLARKKTKLDLTIKYVSEFWDFFEPFTPPIAEIICVKNVGAIVVCGFLMK